MTNIQYPMPDPVVVVRHPRARRYVLRLASDGALRLTVPRRGSVEGGLRFIETQRAWIERERARLGERATTWGPGTVIWWRGERVTLAHDGDAIVCGDQRIPHTVAPAVFTGQGSLFGAKPAEDWRPRLEQHFRKVAARELPPRCLALAADHAVPVARVFVRNQRARWGACSSTGTITLNWRLLQAPPMVSDYVIFHELMHRRQPNHSRRFWKEVASVCPWWRDAEHWIKRNGRTIL
jgi:predicted metal-dependent hydrolase